LASFLGIPASLPCALTDPSSLSRLSLFTHAQTNVDAATMASKVEPILTIALLQMTASHGGSRRCPYAARLIPLRHGVRKWIHLPPVSADNTLLA
jgi:hypothetical protein